MGTVVSETNRTFELAAMIRALTHKNEVALLLPCIEHDATAVGYDLNRINYEKLLAMLEHCFDYARIYVAEADDKIVGIMVLHLVELYWSDDYVLTNLVYWVDPEHRKSRFGVQLLKAAKDYATERKLPFDLRVESYHDLERKEKFFKRHGFTPCGGNFKFRSK